MSRCVCVCLCESYVYRRECERVRACVSVCEVAGTLAMANTLFGETWTALMDIHDGSTEDKKFFA